jgi:hypothetical protein
MGAVGTYRGALFYVDPSASADGDGSAANPWKDLQTVVDSLVETTAYDSYPYTSSKGRHVVNKGAPVKPGDTIVLADGDYGPLSIHEKLNLREITIRAAEGAHPRFDTIHIRASSLWRLSGLTIDNPTVNIGNANRTMLFIESHGWRGPSNDIVIENCHISSGNTYDPRTLSADEWNTIAWSGIRADGDRITIRNNQLTTVNFGISVTGNDCLVQNNLIDGFCGDAMRGLGNGHVFEYNTVQNCYVVNGNHCDGFQSWVVEGEDPPERITLRGNKIFQWTGERPQLSEYLQGIGLFDGPYIGWRIENNLVVTDMYHGITISGGIDCLIVNNTAIDEQKEPWPAGSTQSLYPWISVGNHKNGTPSSNCLIRNNVAPRILVGEGCKADHNIEAKYEDYPSLFVDPQAFDFRPRPRSLLDGTAYYRLAPPLDITRSPRPLGGGFDIGAFER